MLLRVKNALASVGVVALAYVFHHVSPTNRFFLERLYGIPGFSFTGAEFLLGACVTYALLVAIYFLLTSRLGTSKSLRFWQVLFAAVLSPRDRFRAGLQPQDRLAVLATLLKALFGPLMAMALMSATMALIGHLAALVLVDFTGWTFREWFDRHGFFAMFQIIIMADVIPFTVGYLVEHPRLKNEIRSVDPTLLGWAAALVCYAPFNFILTMFLGPPGSEFPHFENDTIHLTLNFTILGLMAIYASASLALGFKGSNLTHRGIVTRGPYRFVRHPAYACKNLAWWIGSLPILTAAFAESATTGIIALASVVGWTLLYVLRAVTEEDHLRRVDDEYARYADKVRYRFVPGLF